MSEQNVVVADRLQISMSCTGHTLPGRQRMQMRHIPAQAVRTCACILKRTVFA
jgi:hypothetical protein